MFGVIQEEKLLGQLARELFLQHPRQPLEAGLESIQLLLKPLVQTSCISLPTLPSDPQPTHGELDLQPSFVLLRERLERVLPFVADSSVCQ